MTNTAGIYIHIPFCSRKCGYCSFYSVSPTCDIKEKYVKKISEEIGKWGGQVACPIDTLYIGGGTPSLLCGKELFEIVTAVKKSFTLLPDAEITVEINPGDKLDDFLRSAKECGVNRISVGVQSANDTELKMLGRRHTFDEAKAAVELAGNMGFNNISADIMIGLPNSTEETLKKSIEGILSLGTQHISAYILKLEEDSPLFKAGTTLPDDDEVADQYLLMCEAFENAGLEHYEISNFAKAGYQSRHNNRYWLLSDYIGIGPAAHSFFGGKRFYYPADLEKFLTSTQPVFDGEGGSKDEYVMLALRLKRGLVFQEYEALFGEKVKADVTEKAELFAKNGLCICDKDHISLTDKGMLVSNTIIGELI